MFFFVFYWQGILQWVMAESVHRDNREMQERILLMQKEKDQVRYKERGMEDDAGWMTWWRMVDDFGICY